MTLQEWTERLIDGSAPKAISDMPNAMRACKDPAARAAFLVAYRDAIKRDTPDGCSFEVLGSNLDYIGSEYDLPMSWGSAVRLAFPKVDRPRDDKAISHDNEWGRKIIDNVRKMIAAADKAQRQHVCVMNEHPFIANPGDTVDDVCAEFFLEGMIYRFKGNARRRFGQVFATFGEQLFDLIGDRDG